MKLQSDWIDYFAKAMFAETALLQNKWKNFGVNVRQMTPATKKSLTKKFCLPRRRRSCSRRKKCPAASMPARSGNITRN